MMKPGPKVPIVGVQRESKGGGGNGAVMKPTADVRVDSTEAMPISASGEFGGGSSGRPTWTGFARSMANGPNIPCANDILPWKVTDISINPYADDWAFNDRWSFNPSIQFDGKTWLCCLRTSNYAMPDGVEVKAPRSHLKVTRSRNVMLVLDPKTWKPLHVHRIAENDGYPRNNKCTSWGFEDIRLFRTTRGGLHGICASLQLGTETIDTGGRRGVRPMLFGDTYGVLAEQVLLSFDANYDITSARPLRVSGHTRRSQKNWSPFDGTDDPRFMYSIDGSVVFDSNGQMGSESERPEVQLLTPAPPPSDASTMQFDSPNVMFSHRNEGARASTEPGRGTGGPGIATGDYYGLRGGSQLVRVDDNLWLGIGHDGRYVNGIKIYCHTFYATDDTGLLIARSEPFKLRSDRGGIEFAAGIAVVGDRCVISYGVDDMRSELAETSLQAVVGMLRSIAAK